MSAAYEQPMDELRRQRDEARAEVARLHDEVWRREAVIQRVREVRDRYAARAEEYDEKVRQYGPLGMGAMFARDRDLARQVVQAIVHALEAETDD